MGLLVDGAWQEDISRTKDGNLSGRRPAFAISSPPTAVPARPAKAALPPKPAAIISMFRSPARGRIAQ